MSTWDVNGKRNYSFAFSTNTPYELNPEVLRIQEINREINRALSSGENNIILGRESVATNTCPGKCSGGMKMIGRTDDPLSGFIVACEVCNKQERT